MVPVSVSSSIQSSADPTAMSGGQYSVNNANSPSYRKPAIDLENPVHLAVLAAVAVGAVIYFKRRKK